MAACFSSGLVLRCELVCLFCFVLVFVCLFVRLLACFWFRSLTKMFRCKFTALAPLCCRVSPRIDQKLRTPSFEAGNTDLSNASFQF